MNIPLFPLDALLQAACFGQTLVLRDLLDLGLNAQAANADGRTALHCAAENGQDECVKLLLPLSAPQALDAWGNSPLHGGAQNGHLSCLALLLPYSNLSTLNALGRSALQETQINHHTQAQQLLEAWADQQDSSILFKKRTALF